MVDSPFAVIFDMDGVLVDSEPLTVRAYMQAAAEFGVTFDPAEYTRRVVLEGCRVADFLQERGGRREDWNALFARKTECYQAMARGQLQLMPGARALLHDLQAHTVPRALATSASRVTMEVVFAAHHLASLLDVTVTLEDVTRPKPSPEIFLLAATRLAVPPDQCLVIEDAPKGIAAARAAGMHSVGLVNRLASADALAGADLLVTSLEELSAARLRTLVNKRADEHEPRPT